MESRIAKIDEDKRLVFGWASVSVRKDGSHVIDGEDDIVPPDELEKAAYDFVLKSREANVNHSGPSVGLVVESFVSTPEKLEKMGLAPDALPTGWWFGVHVEDDDAWAGVKSGKYAAFSIEGAAKRVEV